MVGTTTLSNHLLIAMPQLADPNFSQTVTLLCEHGERGALGIILNRPLTMTLSEVFDQMKIEAKDQRAGELPVLRGGPVNTDRGFVLHRPGGTWDWSHKISDSIQVTTSRDVLAAMAEGAGPDKAFIALGYAGWDAGQLEKEIRNNSWLAVPANDSIIFDLPYDERWPAALGLLGVTPGQLTGFAGHA
jgi:putative transcriptional regulator